MVDGLDDQCCRVRRNEGGAGRVTEFQRQPAVIAAVNAGERDGENGATDVLLELKVAAGRRVVVRRGGGAVNRLVVDGRSAADVTVADHVDHDVTGVLLHSELRLKEGNLGALLRRRVIVAYSTRPAIARRRIITGTPIARGAAVTWRRVAVARGRPPIRRRSAVASGTPPTRRRSAVAARRTAVSRRGTTIVRWRATITRWRAAITGRRSAVTGRRSAVTRRRAAVTGRGTCIAGRRAAVTRQRWRNADDSDRRGLDRLSVLD